MGVGLRALNPGIARGKLHVGGAGGGARWDGEGIYVLPETVADLPPIGGILTLGEGSSLSHVQLLARNLGIPNVVVGDEHVATLEKHAGADVVVAVSPRGVVQIAEDGERWDELLGRDEVAEAVVIRPDLDKLDLSRTDFVSLAELRAVDSGRISGPKGANLGELTHHFADRVPHGFVIPFGAFRKLLDRPLEEGGPAVYEWMKSEYKAIAGLPEGSAEQTNRVRSFLSRLRAWIRSADPGAEFRDALRAQLERTFGADGSYGVFVRSDTNVEDLPGFTGAGLNETIANVVGSQKVLEAVRRVWASPFTERAYAWRQAHMESPEYVFPAVVVQYSFPAEKSGVLVTADLEGGLAGWLSVAVSEGVGGAVDGQAAESLRVAGDGSDVRLLAQATASRRRSLAPHGGIVEERASGTSTVLVDGEISQLVELAREAPLRFETLRDEDGKALPADIEFAFRDGKLALLQIRPFVENRGAQQSLYLNELDERALGKRGVAVDIGDVPTGEEPSEASGGDAEPMPTAEEVRP